MLTIKNKIKYDLFTLLWKSKHFLATTVINPQKCMKWSDTKKQFSCKILQIQQRQLLQHHHCSHVIHKCKSRIISKTSVFPFPNIINISCLYQDAYCLSSIDPGNIHDSWFSQLISNFTFKILHNSSNPQLQISKRL